MSLPRSTAIIISLLSFFFLTLSSQAGTPLLSSEDAAYLAKFRINKADFPDFKFRVLAQFMNEVSGPFGTEKVYCLMDEAAAKKGEGAFTVLYTLHSSEDNAKKSLESTMKRNPHNPTSSTVSGEKAWEFKANGTSNLAFSKGRITFHLEGKDKALLHEAVKKIHVRGER